MSSPKGCIKCAICRNLLNEHCIVCSTDNVKECCGYVSGASCGHSYHRSCINRWVKTRPTCPLCNTTWINPDGLSLKQMVASKWVDNQERIVELAGINLAPEIYQVLVVDRYHHLARELPTDLPLPQAELLGNVFARYLSVDQLQQIINQKQGLIAQSMDKQRQALEEYQSKKKSSHI